MAMMMKRVPDRCFVETIANREITIVCSDNAHADVLKRLGGSRDLFRPRWTLRAESDEQLACLLTVLRDNTFAFVGGASGWPPAEVFFDMRHGDICTARSKKSFGEHRMYRCLPSVDVSPADASTSVDEVIAASASPRA